MDKQILSAQRNKIAEQNAKKDRKAVQNLNDQFININDMEASRATRDEKESAKRARNAALERYKELYPAEWAEQEARKAANVIHC